LVLQLLEKKRESRPGSGRDVADRLEDIASAGSMGGKKTTVAFLAHLLPAAPSRGNPVSEVQPKPDPRPPVGHTVPALPGVMASSPSQPSFEQSTPKLPPPALMAPPVVRAPSATPGVPVVPVAGVDVTVPATAMAQPEAGPPDATLEAPAVAPDTLVVRAIRPRLDPDAQIAPVTTPAGANAIGNVLAPTREGGGVPVPVLVLGIVGVIGLIGAGAYAVHRFGGSSNTSSADAGVAVVADAGPAVTPPPPPPPPPVAKPVSVKTPNAPSRVRWLVGDAVVGLGAGSVFVPAGTTNLVAEDLRWKVRSTVAINGGVADYGALPTGQVQLVRTSDRIKVTLGDDDVSRQRKLKLVAGHYVFKVEKAGSKKELPVEIKGGETVSLDVAR
jgi:hypothetical protein